MLQEKMENEGVDQRLRTVQKGILKAKPFPNLSYLHIVRLFSGIKVSYKSVHRTSCWDWKRTKSNGYGCFVIKRGGKRHYYFVHRLVYQLLVEPIPYGLTIDHICRNKGCSNPDHLRVVTLRENILCSLSLTAMNHRKTQCKNGHDFSKENTMFYVRKSGPCSGNTRRLCIQCRKRSEEKRNLKRREIKSA